MKNTYLIAIVGIALLQGGYMLFDGIHKLTKGVYFGGQVGPWGHIAAFFGVTPDSVAPVFIVIGALWLVGAVSLLLSAAWAPVLLAVLACCTLAYPLFGTLLAIAVLVLLFLARTP